MSSQIVTFTGRIVDPLNLQPDDVNIIDIAHSLSNQCRFTGHTREFYSVGQHSVLAAEMVVNDLGGGNDLAFIALLHDGSEAYLSDLSKPVKGAEGLGEVYTLVEDAIQATVAEAFGLRYPFPDVVHKVDRALLRAEQRDLMAPADDLYERYPSLLKYDHPITGWAPTDAEGRFLALYTELTGEIPGR